LPRTPNTIAFQGALGAYSHLACTTKFPGIDVLPCPTFDDVFEALERGDARIGMIPIENSLAGRVADIHRLLPKSPFHIIAEHYQPVDHQLLVSPGATRESVEVALSHPQALAQTRSYLRRHHITPKAHADTASAARYVADQKDPTLAAVASRLAGELYGLQTLDSNIQDMRSNTTRFVVLSPEPNETPRTPGQYITSCLFQVRNLPAALYKALGGFATNGVNLLKLESYQLGGFRWTRFAIDVDGHPSDPPVARALEELRYFSTELRILGAYPASRPDDL